MKFGLSDTIIAKMEQVFESNPKVATALVFGSRAKGNYKEGSDIDIAVKGQDLNFNDVIELIGKLDNLDLPYKIDIVNYHTINENNLKDHIDRVGIKLYAFNFK